MKLIIEIPDEVAENKNYCQYFGAWSAKLSETIENGTPPYFPLPEDVFYKITDAEWEHSDNFWVTTPSGKKIEFEKKRPQGKWIKCNFKTFGAFGDWEYKCSNCEKVYGGEYNFCPNCGADMREREK